MVGNTRYLVIGSFAVQEKQASFIEALDALSPVVLPISQNVWAISSAREPVEIYEKLALEFGNCIQLIAHFDRCFPKDFDLHKFLNESH